MKRTDEGGREINMQPLRRRVGLIVVAGALLTLTQTDLWLTRASTCWRTTEEAERYFPAMCSWQQVSCRFSVSGSFLMIAAAEREQSQLERHTERPRFRAACDLRVGARPSGAPPLYHGRCHTDSSVARTAAEAAQTSALHTKVGQRRLKYTQNTLKRSSWFSLLYGLKQELKGKHTNLRFNS